jgi:ribonuclease BN (tRNA processing enzyme)
LLIVGPDKLQHWLFEHHAISQDSPNFVFASCAQFAAPNMRFLGSLPLRTIPVTHIADSWAFCLQTSCGDVIYSGDIKHPCPALVAAGQDAALLIHEATFEDDRLSEAKEKNHRYVKSFFYLSLSSQIYDRCP